MAADSLTATALDARGDRDSRGPGWREQARSNVYWGVAHGLPRLMVRTAARRGDLQGRLMLAPSSGDQVWELFEEARARGPMLRSRMSYLTVDHAAVKEVLTSPDFRSGKPVRADGPLGRLLDRTAPRVPHPLEPPSLLVTDPPDHTRYRKLVNRVFTVRAVDQLRVRTEAIAHKLLDALDPSAPVELISSYCALLPVTVITEILGVPPAQRNRVLELGTYAAPSLDFGLSWRRFRAVTAGLRGFDQWLDTHIKELRRHPGEDLLSQLIEARDEQGALDDRELKATAGLVLAAGFETTVNLLGNGIALLDRHPQQLDRLRRESALWPNAVDETLRFDPPVLLTGRVCARDDSGRHRSSRGRPGSDRPGRREPRPEGVLPARALRRGPRERARPRLLLRRTPLLPRRLAGADGGRGGAAGHQRTVPGPAAPTRRRATADPDPARVRDPAGRPALNGGACAPAPRRGPGQGLTARSSRPLSFG
jgi:cytochrome P450